MCIFILKPNKYERQRERERERERGGGERELGCKYSWRKKDERGFDVYSFKFTSETHQWALNQGSSAKIHIVINMA